MDGIALEMHHVEMGRARDPGIGQQPLQPAGKAGGGSGLWQLRPDLLEKGRQRVRRELRWGGAARFPFQALEFLEDQVEFLRPLKTEGYPQDGLLWVA